mmetsp:Transcript_29352/g.54459  ORF Transcript_29352/g.54459 Transcript_29352/m.54459 type:complete len:241 (-) Transcript_29352:1359-2081(-)
MNHLLVPAFISRNSQVSIQVIFHLESPAKYQPHFQVPNPLQYQVTYRQVCLRGTHHRSPPCHQVVAHRENQVTSLLMHRVFIILSNQVTTQVCCRLQNQVPIPLHYQVIFPLHCLVSCQQSCLQGNHQQFHPYCLVRIHLKCQVILRLIYPVFIVLNSQAKIQVICQHLSPVYCQRFCQVMRLLHNQVDFPLRSLQGNRQQPHPCHRVTVHLKFQVMFHLTLQAFIAQNSPVNIQVICPL